MKIAYFGCDLFIGCLDVFRAHNHDIVAIFVAGNKQENKNICEYAAAEKIQCVTDKPTEQHIKMLEDMGVECFFSIEYEYLIPLPSAQVMTLNMHPTLLPEGRGATPLNYLILQYPQHAGITFHKLASHFDEGDIVYQSPVQLDDNEGLESLVVKLSYKIPKLLNDVLDNLSELYQNAKPQSGGSYWPKITDQQRLLNWQDDINSINLMVRTFGRFGVIACIEQEIWLVNHVEIYKTVHSIPSGTQVAHDIKICVVAVSEGLVVIYKDSIVERRDLNK